MPRSPVEAFQEELRSKLAVLFPGVPVESEWAAVVGEDGLYSPRLDVAVRTFAIGELGARRCQVPFPSPWKRYLTPFFLFSPPLTFFLHPFFLHRHLFSPPFFSEASHEVRLRPFSGEGRCFVGPRYP